MIKTLSEWLETYFDEVSPREFYRDIFPAGELERKGEYIDGMYCGIAVEVTREKKKNGKPKIKRYSITDDLETVEQLARGDNFCLCSPISYAGKERTAEHARFMYAMAVDVDKLQFDRRGYPSGLDSLWNGHIINVGRIPKPTYLVSSGTGLHAYYVFEQAIALFPNVAKQLQALKRELTAIIWNGTIVDIHHENEIQQEGIYQGFRMPGTITKVGTRARAFLTGDKVSLEYLNSFISEPNRARRYTVKKELTKAKAQELYPEWYERRIVKKEPSGVWHTSRRLYDWWKREILEKAEPGHRYWCLMTLVIYARKCGMYDAKHNPHPVTQAELEKDCFEIMEHFESITDDEINHFTEADVADALEAYNDKWIKYPRDFIEYRCGFQIPHNKRNGQKQADHLEEARAIRDIRQRRKGRKWTDGCGRKDKWLDVALWRATHPDGKKADCIRDLGIDKKTVYKHWNAKRERPYTR